MSRQQGHANEAGIAHVEESKTVVAVFGLHTIPRLSHLPLSVSAAAAAMVTDVGKKCCLSLGTPA